MGLRMTLEQLEAEMDAKHKKALEHVHIAMFSLPIEHVANHHLTVAEAFLQRAIFEFELRKRANLQPESTSEESAES